MLSSKIKKNQIETNNAKNKKSNNARKIIIKYFFDHNFADINRKIIENELNLPHTTAYDELKKMLNSGLVEKRKEKRKIKGRPQTFWRLSKEGINTFKFLK